LFVRTALLLSVFGAVNAISARLGPIALSANALLLHLQTLQAFALDGFAHGVEVMTGEAVGERSPERLRVTLRAAWRLTMGTAALIALTYALAHPWLLRQLSAHEEVLERAEGLIIWAVISPLISAPCFLLDGVMIGATRSAEMRRGMIYSALTFALSAALLVPTWGAHGLWAALMSFMLARAQSLRGSYRVLLNPSHQA
jgi:MATE family multidrug resistance protein